MEKYRLASILNGVPPQKPNFLPNPPSQISLPTKPHHQISPHIFPYRRPESEELAGDTEISIFDAERYFNESQDSNTSTKKLAATAAAINSEAQNCNLSPNPYDSSSSLNGFSRNFRSRSFRTTPTASSDASWNSQSGLLRKSPASASASASLSVSVATLSNSEQKKEPPFSSALRIFGHTCPCSCKKSVDVEETYAESKSSNSCVAKMPRVKAEQVSRSKEGVEKISKMKFFPGISPEDPEIFRSNGRCFSLDNTFQALEIGRRIQQEVDPARVSLEVFRPSEKAQKGAFRAGDRRNFAVEDDAASDTSSDLFEIESLSTQTGFRRRDSLDEISSLLLEPRKLAGNGSGISRPPSIAPSECYPPSEASVEWSVTTAEGFDRSSAANFSSAVSEYEQLPYSGRKKGVDGGGGGGGGLLSCRSEKAVCIVGPNSEWFEPDVKGRLVGKLGRDGSGPNGLRSRSWFV